jgi:hypothetical protein
MPGVVDDDIDAAALLDDSFDRSVNRCLRQHVQLKRPQLHSVLF